MKTINNTAQIDQRIQKLQVVLKRLRIERRVAVLRDRERALAAQNQKVKGGPDER